VYVLSKFTKYGAPFNEELYLHRLGRTARAGKKGTGLLVLLSFETSFLRALRKKGIKESGQFMFDGKDTDAQAKIFRLKQLVRCGHKTLTPSAEAACKSFVAHYVEYAESDVSGAGIAEEATDLADSMGLEGIPSLPESLVERIQNRK